MEIQSSKISNALNICEEKRHYPTLKSSFTRFRLPAFWLLFFSFLSLGKLYASISGPTVVCANAASQYTTSFTLGYTYQWNVSGAAQSAANSNTFTVTWGPYSAAVPGLITLVVLDGLGNTVSTHSLNVTINPLPIPKIKPLSTNGCVNTIPPATEDGTVSVVDSLSAQCFMVCDSTIYGYEPAFPSTNHNYTWTIIPSTAAIGYTVASTGSVLVHWGAASPNQVTLRLQQIDALTGCSDSIDLCIQIIPRPNAKFSTFPALVNDTAKICLNSTIGFFDQSTASPNSVINSWFWTFGDGSFSTAQHPSHVYTSPGNFKVKLVVTNQCYCRDSMEVNVFVDSLPGPDIYCVSAMCANGSDYYCTNASCTSYSWSVSGGTITNGSGTPCIDVQWGNTGPGSITLQSAPCASSCAFPTSVLVPILTPTTTITGPNPVCLSSISNYSVPVVPGTSYTWAIAPNGGSSATGTIISGQGTHIIGVLWGNLSGGMKISVAYSNAFLNCSGAANTTVLVAPEHTITGTSVLCDNSNTTFNTNSASSSWTITDANGNPVITQPTGSSINHTFSGPGAYIVYATDLTGTLCSTPAAFQVQVLPLPPTPAVSINTAICPGQTILYTGVPSSNNYYLNWSITGGVPNQTSGNAVSITWGPSAPWVINLTQVMVLPPGCVSNAQTFTMGPATPPPPTISGPSSTCWNKLESYSTTSPADNYQWYLYSNGFGSIIQGSTPQNINVVFNNGTSNLTATLELIVTVCGASNSSTLAINVSPPPAPSISIPTVICQGQFASFSSTTSASKYEWDFGDGSPTFTSTSSSAGHTYTNALPYVITLTVTDPGGCIGTAVTSSIVNVNPTPVANVTSPDPLIACIGGAAFNYTLFASAQVIAGAPSYTWAGPVTGSNNSLVVNQAGTYTMYVSINGCTSATTVQVDTSCTNNGPACTFSNAANAVNFSWNISCSTVNFTPTITGAGGQLVAWSFGHPSVPTSTVNNPSVTYPASGFYLVTLYGQFPASGGGWCPLDTTLLVTVPIFADFKHNFSCGSGLSLVTNFIDQSNWIPTTSIGGYTWSATPGSWTSNSTNPANTFTPGTYTINLTITESGSTVTCTQTKTLVVPQRPAASFTVASQICEGNPLTFTPTASSDIVKYEWDFGDGSGLITQNPSPNGVRTYSYQTLPYAPTLTITDIYGCTHSFGPVGVSIDQNLFTFTNVAVTPTNGIFCQGDSIQLCAVAVGSPTNNNTPYTYLWTNFSTTQCIYASQTGNYGVVFTDNKGCKSQKKIASVGMVIVPVPLIAGDLSYCEGEEPLFSIDKGNTYTYEWIYDFPSTSTTSACSSPLFPPVSPCTTISALTYTPPGTYTLQGLITEQNTTLNCTALGPQIVYTIHPQPPTPVVGTSTCAYNLPASLTASSTSSGTFLWNNGLSGSPISAFSPGKYWASLIDLNGCQSAADTVNVWPLPDFNSVLTGCYDICDSGTVIIPTPPGYAMYEWIKIGLGTVVGPSTVAPTNLTISANSPFTGGNAGDYKLVLKTQNGCIDTSAILTINTLPCVACDLELELTELRCELDEDYNRYYSFSMNAIYGGTVTSNFTLSPSSGTITNLGPSTNTLIPGSTTINGTLYPVSGQTVICFNFTVTNSSDLACFMDTCFLLPPCPDIDPCELEPDLDIECRDIDGNGYPVYSYTLNYNSPATGTIYISTPQGLLSTSSATAAGGPSNISGTFTDTPVNETVLCLDIFFFDGAVWCYTQVCQPMPTTSPCYQEPPPPCNDIQLSTYSLVCYTITPSGQYVYTLTLNMTTGGNDYTFYLNSSSGITGVMNPSLLTSTGGVFTTTFVNVYPGGPGTPICFTLIATNTLTSETCSLEICFTPEECDEDMRLMSTAQLNLYPNPTEDYTIAEYTLDDKSAINKLILIDLNGRVVKEVRLSEIHGKVNINTADLIPGMYFLKAMNNNRTVLVKKLIIQR